MDTQESVNRENFKEKIISYLSDRLAAHEGGAGPIHVSYDDATFCYIITQTKLDKFRTNETLGHGRSLGEAFYNALKENPYGER